MKRIISTFFGLALLCMFAEAQAVPATVSFTGRLSTTNGPVTGSVTLTFSLFNQATNGTVMWTETRPGIQANAGLVYVDLGALTTLDEGILLNSPLFLEINVSGEVLSPRLVLQSVPYAIRSEVANSADLLGTIAPADVVTAVNGGGGISANRSGNTVTLGADTTSTLQARITGVCGPNASIATISTTGTVTCEADTDTTYTAAASSGVSLTGTAFGLTSACTNGQVLKAGAAGTWACGNDTDTTTTYTAVANGGVNVAGTTIGLLTTCANGQVLKAGAVAGTWACAADTDTTTTYTALGGGGASVVGTTIGLLTTCANGQVLKAGAVAGQWACAADTDTTTTYTAIANGGVNIAGTTVGLITTCANGQVLKAGAVAGTWACAADIDTTTTYTALAGGGVSINGSNQVGCGSSATVVDGAVPIT